MPSFLSCLSFLLPQRLTIVVDAELLAAVDAELLAGAPKELAVSDSSKSVRSATSGPTGVMFQRINSSASCGDATKFQELEVVTTLALDELLLLMLPSSSQCGGQRYTRLLWTYHGLERPQLIAGQYIGKNSAPSISSQMMAHHSLASPGR